MYRGHLKSNRTYLCLKNNSKIILLQYMLDDLCLKNNSKIILLQYMLDDFCVSMQ